MVCVVQLIRTDHAVRIMHTLLLTEVQLQIIKRSEDATAVQATAVKLHIAMYQL